MVVLETETLFASVANSSFGFEIEATLASFESFGMLDWSKLNESSKFGTLSCCCSVVGTGELGVDPFGKAFASIWPLRAASSVLPPTFLSRDLSEATTSLRTGFVVFKRFRMIWVAVPIFERKKNTYVLII